MKRLLTFMVGLSFLTTAVVLVHAQDTTCTNTTKKSEKTEEKERYHLN